MTGPIASILAPLLEVALGNALLAAVPAALALAVAGTSRRPRPALVHGLWLLALLKLVTPPLVDVPVRVLPPAPVADAAAPVQASDPQAAEPVAGGPLPVAPRTPAVDPARAAGGAERADGRSPKNSNGRERRPSAGAGAGAPASLAVEVKGPNRTPVANAPGMPPPSRVPSSPAVAWQPLAAAIWIGGAAAALAVMSWRAVRFHRLLRHASPAAPDVVAQARRAAHLLGLGRCPAVEMLPGAVSPMLWAVGGRARLLLPDALWRRLDPGRREALLAHELAHYARRDHWVRWLEMLAAVAYWWHPVVWLARRHLRDAEEQCCDARVVRALPGPGRAREYACALVDTVDFIAEEQGNEEAGAADGPGPGGAWRPRVPLAATGAGTTARQLKRRLTMILTAHPRTLSSLGRVALLALGLVLLPALPRLAAAEDGDRPREGDRPRAEGERPRDGDRPRGEGRERSGAGQKESIVRGTFMSADGTTLVLSVGEAGREVRVGTEADTTVTVDGAAAKVADLKNGMQVQVRQVEGLTTRVDARSPRGAVRRDGEGGGREGEVRRDGDAPRREGDVRRDGEGNRREGEVRRDGEGNRREGEVRRDGEGGRRVAGRSDAENSRRLEQMEKLETEIRQAREQIGDLERKARDGEAGAEEKLRDQRAQVEKKTAELRELAAARRQAEARAREGEVRRDGEGRREGEVRRDGEGRREGEVRRDGEGRAREGEARARDEQLEKMEVEIRQARAELSELERKARDGDAAAEEKLRERRALVEKQTAELRELAAARRQAQAREREGAAREREGAAREREGAAREREGEARAREGEARRDGEVRVREGQLRVTTMRGQLLRVDDNKLVLRGDNERVVATDSKTRVWVDGKPAELSDLKPGMSVSARQVQDVTTEIEARTAR